MTSDPTADGRPCPDRAALNIAGQHYPCDAMRGISPDSSTHDGWPHSNREAGAVWSPLPQPGTVTVNADALAGIEERLTEVRHSLASLHARVAAFADADR